METKTIVQLAVFEDSPERVYAALMDSREHSDFTGSPAQINPRVGGKFTAYDGYITGTFLEIDPKKRIVQNWRASDWPPGISSTVTITINKQREVTALRLTQEGVPADFAESISQGWHDFYWDRLRTYLERG